MECHPGPIPIIPWWDSVGLRYLAGVGDSTKSPVTWLTKATPNIHPQWQFVGWSLCSKLGDLIFLGKCWWQRCVTTIEPRWALGGFLVGLVTVFFEVFSCHNVQYPTWKDSDSKLSIESSLQAVRVSRTGFMLSSFFILVTLFGRTSAGWPKKHLDIWGAGAWSRYNHFRSFYLKIVFSFVVVFS